jgi:hypothetical protein
MTATHDILREDYNELVAVLRPFVREFRRRVENPRDSLSRRNWNEAMPGKFPIAIDLTMDDCRRARAILAKLKALPDV